MAVIEHITDHGKKEAGKMPDPTFAELCARAPYEHKFPLAELIEAIEKEGLPTRVRCFVRDFSMKLDAQGIRILGREIEKEHEFGKLLDMFMRYSFMGMWERDHVAELREDGEVEIRTEGNENFGTYRFKCPEGLLPAVEAANSWLANHVVLRPEGWERRLKRRLAMLEKKARAEDDDEEEKEED